MFVFTEGGKRKKTASFCWTVLGIREEGYFELGWGFGLLPPETHSLLAEAAAIERVIKAFDDPMKCTKHLKKRELENNILEFHKFHKLNKKFAKSKDTKFNLNFLSFLHGKYRY